MCPNWKRSSVNAQLILTPSGLTNKAPVQLIIQILVASFPVYAASSHFGATFVSILPDSFEQIIRLSQFHLPLK
jgi:hypothetical protein